MWQSAAGYLWHQTGRRGRILGTCALWERAISTVAPQQGTWRGGGVAHTGVSPAPLLPPPSRCGQRGPGGKPQACLTHAQRRAGETPPPPPRQPRNPTGHPPALAEAPDPVQQDMLGWGLDLVGPPAFLALGVPCPRALLQAPRPGKPPCQVQEALAGEASLGSLS